MDAAIASLRQVLPGSSQADTAKLDPDFVYLRVTRGKHVGLLWRGNIERTPAGDTEVYYSGSGEVVRLRHGLVVGALGTNTEWRRVEMPTPRWAAVAAAGESQPFERVRDVMPGYRTGVRDRLVMKVIPAPSSTSLVRIEPGTLTWFEESMAPGRWADRLRGADAETLPPARYAVSFAEEQPTVVYAEQCLGPDFCFTWQRWSAAARQAAAASSAR